MNLPERVQTYLFPSPNGSGNCRSILYTTAAAAADSVAAAETASCCCCTNLPMKAVAATCRCTRVASEALTLATESQGVCSRPRRSSPNADVTAANQTPMRLVCQGYTLLPPRSPVSRSEDEDAPGKKLSVFVNRVFFFPVCLLSCRTTPRRAADPFATLVRSCMLGCDAHAAVSTFVSFQCTRNTEWRCGMTSADVRVSRPMSFLFCAYRYVSLFPSLSLPLFSLMSLSLVCLFVCLCRMDGWMDGCRWETEEDSRVV